MSQSGKEGESEKSIDNFVLILWKELHHFIESSERTAFLNALMRISKKDLQLSGISSPKKAQVTAKAKEYFVKFVPQLYDRILHNTAEYAFFEGAGRLELFMLSDDYFSHMDGVIKEIEFLVEAKYKK